MRTYLLFTVLFLLHATLYSQEYKYDSRMQILKEDGLNEYQSDKITHLDVIQGLALAGISINKYSLGVFDKKYSFLITLDEFKNGKKINSDTIINTSNEYTYYESGEEKLYTAYIDRLKIFTKTADTSFTLKISTYKMSSTKQIDYEKYDTESQYYIRSYEDARWRLGEKVPLMVYASSWKNEKWGFQQFCGVLYLKEEEEATKELLSSSPHYYVVSYIVQ